MADIKQIQFKRTKVAGRKPSTTQLAEGELGINLTDRTLFTNNGSQIIDLGFAKGGNIDGDVTQKGNYTQTGGNFSTTGDIYGKTLIVSSGVNSDGEIRSNNGVLRTFARADANAHVWFQGEECSTANNRSNERAVLYALKQEVGKGQVNLRVYNGSEDAATASHFGFFGVGDFEASRDLIAKRHVNGIDYNGQRVRLSIEAIAPTMNASRLYTRERIWGQFGAQQNEGYGWNDLVNYDEGQNGALKLNYVYKGRAYKDGTVWHDLIDERTGAERTVYTGGTASDKQMSMKNNAGVSFIKSLLVGNPSNYSAMPGSSIAIGGPGTGLYTEDNNTLNIRSTNRVINLQIRDDGVSISNNRLTLRQTTNNGTEQIVPASRAILTVETSTDNNAVGDEQTHLGYNASGVYHHYFRGKGATNIETKGGTRITEGDLNVTNNIWAGATINASGGVRAAGGDFTLRSHTGRHLRFEYQKNDGSWAVDGYVFKDGVDQPNRRPGLRISCGTPNKVSGNTSDSGTFIFGEDGSFTLPGGGVINQDGLNQNVYGISSLSTTASGSKNYLRKFRGGNADTIWHETVQGGAWRLATGNTDSQEQIVVTSAGDLGLRNNLNMGGALNAGSVNSEGEIISKASSIRVRSAATSHLWLENAAGKEKAVIYAENNGNSVKIRANRSSDATAQNATWAFSSDGTFSAPGRVNVANGVSVNGGSTFNAGIVINSSDGAVIMNAPGSNACYLRGQNNGANKWYVGNGSNTNDFLTLRSDALNSQLAFTLVNGSYFAEFNRQVNAPEFYLSSDITLKTNIVDIESQRDKLNKVEIKRYSMKDGSNDNAIGVIAQQVEEVYPEMVSTTSDGLKTVNYRGLSTVLWKIVQEQDKELDDVKARLARIEELLK